MCCSENKHLPSRRFLLILTFGHNQMCHIIKLILMLTEKTYKACFWTKSGLMQCNLGLIVSFFPGCSLVFHGWVPTPWNIFRRSWGSSGCFQWHFSLPFVSLMWKSLVLRIADGSKACSILKLFWVVWWPSGTSWRISFDRCMMCYVLRS